MSYPIEICVLFVWQVLLCFLERKSYLWVKLMQMERQLPMRRRVTLQGVRSLMMNVKKYIILLIHKISSWWVSFGCCQNLLWWSSVKEFINKITGNLTLLKKLCVNMENKQWTRGDNFHHHLLFALFTQDKTFIYSCYS